MAKLSRRRVAKEVVRLLIAHPEQKDKLLKQVAAYLVQTKQARAAHLLIDDIATELLDVRGSLSAQVYSALDLPDATRDSVVIMLKKATGATSVELSEVVDPSLIGGIIIRTPQLELDASVKRQLTQLAGGM